jgi:hypothetical protein
LTVVEKKEKRRQAGLVKKTGGAHISDGLMAITDGYGIGMECLAWARGTRLEKTGKFKGKCKGKSREVRTNSVE